MQRPISNRKNIAPTLSSEHLRFAQSIHTSGASTVASSFLTPLLSNQQVLSPPPRQDGHDYFNLHGRNEDVQKHRKKAKRPQKEAAGVERTTPEPMVTPSTVSVRNDCEIPIPKNDSDAPMKYDEVDSLRCDDRSLENLIPHDAKYAHVKYPKNISPMDEDTVDSPAAKALRKLSQSQSTNTDIDPLRLRRASTALSKTIGFLTSRTSFKDSRFGHYGVESRSGKRDTRPKSLANRKGPNRDQSPQENDTLSDLSTPKSITLRKASCILVPNLPGSSMSASLSHEDEGMRDPDAPTSELLAFYSTITRKEGRTGSSNNQSPDAIISPVDPAQETKVTTDSGLPRRQSSFTGQLPKVRQHGVLAATTTTFADVHVAPGTFEVAPSVQKSRATSSAAGDQRPRRISVVQFRSRDSVYEVVWREDETTSGSSLATSSRTSTSPRQQGYTLQYFTPSSEDKTSPTKQCKHALDPVESTSSYPGDQNQDNLFQWSWTEPVPPSASEAQQNERKNGRPNLMRWTSTSNPDLTRPQRPSVVLNLQRRSISETPDILSFPPLRDRSSTLEWCQAPLVDLNDPSAGRTKPYSTRADTSSAAIESGSSSEQDGVEHDARGRVLGDSVKLSESFGSKRINTDLHEPSRRGFDGRVGSSIGISCRARLSRSRRS